MNLTETLLSFTVSGVEWVLWLLVAVSFISIAVIIERYVYFFFLQKNEGSLLPQIQLFLKEKKVQESIDFLKTQKTVSARVVQAGLEKYEHGSDYINEVMECEVMTMRKKLSRGLVFLSTMGNNAPFIGLFGTVLGIVKAFQDLSFDASAGAEAVMAGISEALVATAVGLFVAIPAVLANNFFQKKISNMLIDAQTVRKTVYAQLKFGSLE